MRRVSDAAQKVGGRAASDDASEAASPNLALARLADGTQFARKPKLTKDQAREALKRVPAGERCAIALSYEIDYSTISRLKAWHATEMV